MLPLVAAQGGLRLQAEAHALLARALLTDADAETLKAGGADWCASLCDSLLSRVCVCADGMWRCPAVLGHPPDCRHCWGRVRGWIRVVVCIVHALRVTRLAAHHVRQV